METSESVMNEIFELLKAKTSDELSWEEKCRQTRQAILLMRQESMKEHEQYLYAIRSYAVQVGACQEGSSEEAQEWLLEWIEQHPEEGTDTTLDKRLEEIGWCYNRLSYVCEKRDKNYEKAISYFKKHVAIIQRLYGDDSDYAGDELDELAEMYARSKDMKNACYYKKKSVEIYLDVSGALEKWPKVLRPIVLFIAKTKECMLLPIVHLFKKE